MDSDFTPVQPAPPAAEPAAEPLTTAAAAPPRGLWARLRAVRGGADPADRLAALTDAAAASPDAPANYLLRAELYARLGEDALALADFNRAQTLAASAFERHNWGLVNQALRDRAAAGAASAQQRLARRAPGRPFQPQAED